jgi:hypothetical protein
MVDETNTSAKDESVSDEAVDGAWKIFDAQSSWIERADVKASIILALETAVLGFVMVLSSNNEVLAGLHGPRRATDLVAVGLLLLSALISLSAIIPKLGRSRKAADNPGVIYFGHVRHWNPRDLGRALRDGRPTNDDVADQVIILARVSWRKHARLQGSIIFLAIGALLLTILMAWPAH